MNPPTTPPPNPSHAGQAERIPARLYAILDTGYAKAGRFSWLARELIAGGAGIVQVRAKSESTRERIRLIETVLPECEAGGVPLIVNDDIEAATEFPGLGLHLGQDDLAVESARERLGPGPLIGLSTHSREQALEAYRKALEGVIDYFAIGPVFATPTKPTYEPVTLDLVDWAAAQGFKVPHFFIGGVNLGTVHAVASRGARRVVVVSDLLKAEDPRGQAAAILAKLLMREGEGDG